MYKVKIVSQDQTLEKTVFQSHNDQQCWSLIEQYLRSSSAVRRSEGRQMFVVDKLDQQCDCPVELVAMFEQMED